MAERRQAALRLFILWMLSFVVWPDQHSHSEQRSLMEVLAGSTSEAKGLTAEFHLGTTYHSYFTLWNTSLLHST